MNDDGLSIFSFVKKVVLFFCKESGFYLYKRFCFSKDIIFNKVNTYHLNVSMIVEIFLLNSYCLYQNTYL